MEQEDYRPCRSVGCDFSGHRERRYYCSQCYKKQEELFINGDNPAIEPAVFGQLDPEWPLAEENSKRCTNCQEFFGSPEYGKLCHGCFLKMTSATGQTQPEKCKRCIEYFASPEYGGYCHDCFMKLTQQSSELPRDSPRGNPYNTSTGYHPHTSTFDNRSDLRVSPTVETPPTGHHHTSAAIDHYRPSSDHYNPEPVYGNIDPSRHPDLSRRPDPSRRSDSSLFNNHTKFGVPVFGNPTAPDPPRTHNRPDPFFGEHAIREVPVYNNDITEPSWIQTSADPSTRPPYPLDTTPVRHHPLDTTPVRHHTVDTPLYGIPDPSVQMISNPSPVTTVSTRPIPLPRVPRSEAKPKKSITEKSPTEGHDPFVVYTRGRSTSELVPERTPVCFICDSNEPITILNVICQQHALQIRNSNKPRFDVPVVTKPHPIPDRNPSLQYPLPLEITSRVHGHLNRLEGGASSQGVYWRDPAIPYRPNDCGLPEMMNLRLESTDEERPVKVLCRSVGCSFFQIPQFDGYCSNCFESQR